MTVNDGGNGSLKYDLGLGINMDRALFDCLVVAYQTLSAVGFHAVQVSQNQNVGDLRRLLLGKAKLVEGIATEFGQLLTAVSNGAHRNTSFHIFWINRSIVFIIADFAEKCKSESFKKIYKICKIVHTF